MGTSSNLNLTRIAKAAKKLQDQRQSLLQELSVPSHTAHSASLQATQQLQSVADQVRKQAETIGRTPALAQWVKESSEVSRSLGKLIEDFSHTRQLRVPGVSAFVRPRRDLQKALERITESAKLPSENLTRALSESTATYESLCKTLVSEELVETARLGSTSLQLFRGVSTEALDNLAASRSMASRISSALGAHTRAYSDLTESLGAQVQELATIPPLMVESPAVEVFREANLLWTTSGGTIDEEVESSREEITTELDRSNRKELPSLLEEVDPALVPMWRGAREAVDSDNPDRARQVSTSLRELFNWTVRELAPEEDVRNWTTDPEHFTDDGRITRRARLLFICRGINSDPFTDYLQKDVRAVLAFQDLFHRLHRKEVDFSDRQLDALVDRSESNLMFLIRSAKTDWQSD